MKMDTGRMGVFFHTCEVYVYNLVRIKRVVENIVDVDNSAVLDVHLHERIRNAGIDILPNFNKGGVAGAYNRGLERLIGKMCQILFIFDQDSAVPDDYFTQMQDACLALGNPHFLVGPKIFDINVNRYLPAHMVRRFGVKSIPITDQKQGLVSCSSIITSGSAMP